MSKPTPPVAILTPDRTGGPPSGGALTQLRLAEALASVADVATIPYELANLAPLTDHLSQISPQTLIIGGWGPHIPTLSELCRNSRFVYWANSVGWFDSLAPRIPILCASRYTMGYWGELAPRSPIYYLPNPLGAEFTNRGLVRTTDVLVQTRKNSTYVTAQLVPELESAGLTVKTLSGPVEDLADEFNRARVFLYDSRDYWLASGVSEGFGLPPLEAVACGCHVFSSLNGGLADYLDPVISDDKVGVYSARYDAARIVDACQRAPEDVTDRLVEYRPRALAARWLRVSADLDRFFTQLPDLNLRAESCRLDGPRVYRRTQPSLGQSLRIKATRTALRAARAVKSVFSSLWRRARR